MKQQYLLLVISTLWGVSYIVGEVGPETGGPLKRRILRAEATQSTRLGSSIHESAQPISGGFRSSPEYVKSQMPQERFPFNEQNVQATVESGVLYPAQAAPMQAPYGYGENYYSQPTYVTHSPTIEPKPMASQTQQQILQPLSLGTKTAQAPQLASEVIPPSQVTAVKPE